MADNFRILSLIIFISVVASRQVFAATLFQKIHYGTSSLGKDLYAYKIFDDGSFEKRFAVLITDGVHGNEYAGMAEGIVKHFRLSYSKSFEHFLLSGGILMVVPQVNPDGVASGSRYTTFAVDLNRDFGPGKFKEPESSHLAKWLNDEMKKRGVQLKLAVDYHCCKGAIIHRKLTEIEDHSLHQTIFDVSSLMNKWIDPYYKHGPTEKIFGYETHGTLKDFLFQEFGATSFTFEGISIHGELQKLKRHVLWWESIFAYIDDAKAPRLAEPRP